MRVLFDGYWWSHGPMANRTVMREFFAAWTRSFPKDEVVLALRAKVAASALSDVPAGVETVRTRISPHGISNAIELPRLQRRTNSDWSVVHNFAPLYGRSAVFIHDLLFEEHPEWFTRKELAYFSLMSRLADNGSVVATSTTTEARRIERLHPNLRPVSAIGLGVSRDLAYAQPKRPESLPAGVDNFVMSVGRLNRRKNLGVALEGAARSRTISDRRPMVVVGSSEYSGKGAHIPESLRDHISSGRILFLGRATDAELRWLYAHADALVFLSLDEGFGLPPLEASTFGTSVIVSDIQVMREVAGKHARFVDPTSPHAVAEAIDEVALRPRTPIREVVSVEGAWDAAVAKLRHRMLQRSGGSVK